MGIRDLFGKAKSTAKKTKRGAKRAEEKAEQLYDQEVRAGVEAHKRGSRAVGERFGRANKAAGEYASDTFGFSEDSDFASGMAGGEIDLGVGGGSADMPDALGGGGSRQMPDALSGTPTGFDMNGDNTPDVPDSFSEPMDFDNGDDLW